MRWELAGVLRRHFEPAALVLEDVIHKLGPGLPAPAPDVSVILGAWPGKRSSFSVPREKVRPDLVIEIVSPTSRKIRDVDEVDKVKAYARAGIPEYVLVDLPRLGNGEQLGLKGYRLGPEGRYSPIPPDSQGRLFCTVTRLWFFISPEGDRVRILDDRTGTLLLYSDEQAAAKNAAEAAKDAAEAAKDAAEAAKDAAEAGKKAAEAAKKAAEERAAREAKSRKAVEAENARLRKELERLKRGSGME